MVCRDLCEDKQVAVFLGNLWSSAPLDISVVSQHLLCRLERTHTGVVN